MTLPTEVLVGRWAGTVPIRRSMCMLAALPAKQGEVVCPIKGIAYRARPHTSLKLPWAVRALRRPAGAPAPEAVRKWGAGAEEEDLGGRAAGPEDQRGAGGRLARRAHAHVGWAHHRRDAGRRQHLVSLSWLPCRGVGGMLSADGGADEAPRETSSGTPAHVCVCCADDDRSRAAPAHSRRLT